MLKLLVADDERILREAVCYLIDWKSIGIELAASCKNGREAYEEAIYTRRQLQQMEPTCAGVARPEYSETVQKVVDYLEKHYSDAALSLKGLAANYLFMNPDYVSRQFLQQTGYRFVDYLLALRIRKAQWLLVNGVPPQQVPERVGYSANPQYFVHLFSKATGMTPREYAQALRIEP